MSDHPVIDPEVFYPPGSFFLGRISGWTGRWVSAAQAFTRGGSYWTHAGVVLDNGQIIQAEPGGAEIVSVETLLDREILISDDPIQRALDLAVLPQIVGSREGREAQFRKDVVWAARKLEGTPYSFLDYVALAAVEARLPGAQKLRGYVQESGHLICSALVDAIYRRAGIHLFDDGRLPGDVTPGDLDRWVRTARDGDLDPVKFTLRGGHP